MVNFEVRMFDETDLISADHKAIMNERINDMKHRFQVQALAMQEATQKIIHKV